jgi:hypothetical protein
MSDQSPQEPAATVTVGRLRSRTVADRGARCTRRAVRHHGHHHAAVLPGASRVQRPPPHPAAGTAAGVEVTGANWALGTVPLDTAVRPSCLLRNTGSATVQLGEPHPEVREGCCPGPFSLGQPTLEPSESTTLTFELAMHAGMDGWHDIAVHLPVAVGDASEMLTLGVTGDFR